MGLFDIFNKPASAAPSAKKPPPAEATAEIPPQAALEAELEFVTKQMNNLHAVDRIPDAKREFGRLLKLYHNLWQPCSQEDLARISYFMAFRMLPHVIFNDWNKFCELRNGYMPISRYFAMRSSIPFERSMNHEQLLIFKVFLGQLNNGRGTYYAFRFPTPPPVDPNDTTATRAQKAAAEGRKLSPNETKPLAPYFAALLEDTASSRSEFLVLSQSPDGAASLRSVTAELSGRVASCPEPTKEAFLQMIKARFD